jgi:hypothetical protein
VVSSSAFEPSITGVDLPLLIGYLERRYQYKGRYVELGCSSRDNLFLVSRLQHKSDEDVWLPFQSVNCIDPNSKYVEPENKISFDQYFEQQLKDLKDEKVINHTSCNQSNICTDSIDLLVIDEEDHECRQIIRSVMNSLPLLSMNGTILITNALPRQEIEGTYPKSKHAFYWLGDIWKAVLALRTVHSIDIVLCDFDL